MSVPYNVVLALGKARLLLSRKLYGTSFSSNTCVMKVGFKLCAVYRFQSGAAVDFSGEQILSYFTKQFLEIRSTVLVYDS